jgi:hypothetical protein
MEAEGSKEYSLDPAIVSPMNPSYFHKIDLIPSFHLCLHVPSNFGPPGFLTKILYACLTYVIRATWAANFTLPHLM